MSTMSAGSSSQQTYRQQQQAFPSSNSSISYFGKMLDGRSRLHSNGDHHHDLELRSVSRAMSHFRLIGFVTGVTVQLVSLAGQLISLGAVTKAGMSYGDDNQVLQEANDVGATSTESILSGILWIISHLSIALWPVVWMIPFVLSMTDTGSAWAQRKFYRSTTAHAATEDVVSQRTLFVSGVNIFVGISIGSFFAMCIVDGLFGFPVNVFKLLFSLVVCLALCHIMILCYDAEEMKWNRQGEGSISRFSPDIAEDGDNYLAVDDTEEAVVLVDAVVL